MRASRKRIDENRIRLTVSIDADEVEERMQAGSVVFAQQNQILPQRDKKPYDIVCDAKSKDEVDKFLTSFIMDYYAPFAISDRKILTIGAPSYSADAKLEMGKPFSYRIFVVECPQYSLESYDPVEITVQPFSISEKEFQDYVAQTLDQMKEFCEVDPSHETVENGDIINLKMEAWQNGERLEALCSDKRPFQSGQGLMPKGFEEQIVGMKVGQTKRFTFDGPSMEFDEEGNPVMEPYEAEVTVLSFAQEKAPEINDEWVRTHFPIYKDAEEYMESLRAQFTKVKENEYRHYKNYMSASELARRFKQRIPDAIYEAVRAEQQQGFDMQLKSSGLTKEQFFEQNGIDEQQFSMMQMMQMREQMTQQFSIDALARHENLKLDEEDLNKFFNELTPGQQARTRKNFEDSGRMYIAEQSAMRLKANDWLTEHAIIHIAEQDGAQEKGASAGTADEGDAAEMP